MFYRNDNKHYKGTITILCLFVCLSLYSCYSSPQDNLDEAYQEGYDEGYEEGWDAQFDIMYDELVCEESDKTELIRLMFEATYDGKELKDEEVWCAGNFALKYHFEQEKYLCFDIRFTDFDIKTICVGDMHDFIENMPITCYIGSYDEHGDYTVRKEYFVGEKIFFDEYEFTSDGYLTDYIDYHDVFHENKTLYILLFVDGKVYAATYNID